MKPNRARFSWPLAVTVIALAVLIVGAIWSKGIIDKVVDFWKPGIVFNEQTLITTVMGELKQKAKLIVLTTHVAAQVEAENEVEFEIFGVTIPRGKTRVKLRSTKNKVQFVIPLENLAAADFKFDTNRNELTVRLPHPVADSELVELDPLPEIETEVGWLRLDSRSGEHLRNQARGMVREFALGEANRPIYSGEARKAGETAVSDLLKPALDQVPGQVQLRIEFTDPPKQPAG